MSQTCEACGGEIKAVVTWVHKHTPARKHTVELPNGASPIETRDAQPEATILHLVGRSS